MRFLVLAALFAPASAFACAMPRFDERELAKLMADIDQAAVTAPAPAVEAPAPAVQAPAPAVEAPAAAPAAPRAPAKATRPPMAPAPASVIPEVTATPKS